MITTESCYLSHNCKSILLTFSQWLINISNIDNEKKHVNSCRYESTSCRETHVFTCLFSKRSSPCVANVAIRYTVTVGDLLLVYRQSRGRNAILNYYFYYNSWIDPLSKKYVVHLIITIYRYNVNKREMYRIESAINNFAFFYISLIHVPIYI